MPKLEKKIISKTIEPKVSKPQKSGKILSGKVFSMLMNKTIVVDIERSKTHRLYGKSFKVNTKIKARNDLENLNIGDIVTISETKPISKEVFFKVVKIGSK